jgi:hypothetical protein
MDDFVVFILTHGRADNVITYKTLKKAGYTGPIWLVCDNEDKQLKSYQERFENVYVFDKKAVSKRIDQGDNFDKRNSIVFARNVCFDIAQELGYTYFLELDDDYTMFQFRINQDGVYPKGSFIVRESLTKVFEAYLEYYKSIPALTLAMAQCGDFIGGHKSSYAVNKALTRKAMNTLFCSTKRRFQFPGKINEDVNAYTKVQSMGGLFLTAPICAIDQLQTQSNDGGMTDIYLAGGTYLKSFYSVIYHPSGVKVAVLSDRNWRIHHHVAWNNTAPKILDEKYRKKRRSISAVQQE